MKKRVLALLVLAAMLCAALPAAAAGKFPPVENFTVETGEGTITVTPPEGYAKKGYYKLFWTNTATGAVDSAVFPVDTPSYTIETEPGAEYSLALYYAKKKGSLPAKLPGEPVEPEGPFVWKALWIDVENNESFGFTNRMSEDNRRVSAEASAAFESLVEEMTGGLVDIQVTRMPLEEPVASMTYDGDWGYYISSDDFDLKHYALRKYDSVFIFSRMDGIYAKYGGLASTPESPQEWPGYCNIRLVGDKASPELEAAMGCLCVHEWIHQLGYFYTTLHLEIPNPDNPEDYGYTSDDTLNPDFLREILTMTARAKDGRMLGIPPKAWQYRPGRLPETRSLASLQEQPDPAAAGAADKDNAGESPWAPEDAENPEIYGMMDDEGYLNEAMGLRLGGLEGWVVYSHDDYLATHTVEPAGGEEDEGVSTEQTIVLYAENYERPEYMDVWYVASAADFLREKGVENFLEEQAETNRQRAEQNGWENYVCELTEVRIGDRTFPGLRHSYTMNTVRVWYVGLIWPDGDHVNLIGAGSFMFDTCEEALGKITLLE